MAIKSGSSLIFAVILFLLLAPLLVWFTVSLVKGNRNDTLGSLPLIPEQEITLPASCPVVVMLEMPTLATDFGDFQVELMEKQTEQRTTMKYSYLGSQGEVRGFSKVKMPLGRLTAGSSGAYLVKITGLTAGKNYSDYRLILSRPYLGRMAVQIVGIVVCAVGMLGCVIWAAWSGGLMKQGNVPAGDVPGRTVALDTWKQQQSPPK
jgi:hypothetical protein